MNDYNASGVREEVLLLFNLFFFICGQLVVLLNIYRSRTHITIFATEMKLNQNSVNGETG